MQLAIGLTSNWVESISYPTPLLLRHSVTLTFRQSSWVIDVYTTQWCFHCALIFFVGADIMDPPAKIMNLPSYASLVSSVDSNAAKYIASIQIQPTRQQMIDKMYDMSKVCTIPLDGYQPDEPFSSMLFLCTLDIAASWKNRKSTRQNALSFIEVIISWMPYSNCARIRV